MMRATMMVLALMVLPTAPAAAVVAIETSRTTAETPTASPAATIAPAENPFGLTNGEMVAALVGLSVVSMTMMLGRQQRSVSS